MVLNILLSAKSMIYHLMLVIKDFSQLWTYADGVKRIKLSCNIEKSSYIFNFISMKKLLVVTKLKDFSLKMLPQDEILKRNKNTRPVLEKTILIILYDINCPQNFIINHHLIC